MQRFLSPVLVRCCVLLVALLPVAVRAAGTVVASLPEACVPGSAFVASFAVTPAAGTVVYAVEEQLPAGWTAAGLSHGGLFDAAQGKVKWGPFFDSAARVLTGSLTAPTGAVGVVAFSGEGSFDGLGVAIAGVRELTVLNPALTSDVVCEGTEFFVPGTALLVTYRARPAAGLSVYSVEDQLPAGWSADQLSEGGFWDAAQRKVKWGPFFDAIPRVLFFRLLPPVGAANAVTLTGTGSFDGRPVGITGRRRWTPLSSTVVAALPATFQPGVPVPISLAVTPAPGIQVYSVEDRLPPGWSATTVTAGGIFDVLTRSVKWGPYYTNAGQTLTYQAVPSAAPASVAEFAGVGSFNGVAVAVTGQRITRQAASRVVRELPSAFLPGAGFQVTNRALPAPAVSVYAVEDAVPAGWTVSGINEGGTFDTSVGRVKWGPFFDAVPRTLTYQVLPPLLAGSPAAFDGAGSFDGQPVAIDGDVTTTELPTGVANRVDRIAPAQVRSGGSVWITNRVAPAANVSVYAVEESIAAGWTVVESPLGSWDASQGKVKWGPFFDHDPRDLVYRVVVPAQEAGFFVLAGTASFDGEAVAVTGADLIEVMGNRSPVAGPDLLERPAGQPGFISFADLLANDLDPDGDAVSVLSVSPTSTGGVGLTLTNGGVHYSAPPGVTNADIFTYVISDGAGGRATGVVTVVIRTVTVPLMVVSVERLSASIADVLFRGQPGVTVTVQSKDDLDPAVGWQNRGTRVADPSGNFAFRDTNAVVPVRFYRVRKP